MAENPTDKTPATPPEDNRPKPKYGELAPEGWSWTPPQDDAGTPAVPIAPGAPSGAPAVAPTGAPSVDAAAGPTGAPRWDRPVTLALLIFGLLATFFTVSVLGSLPEALQMLYTQRDLGTYTPNVAVVSLMTAGRFVEGGIWIATAVVSILLLRRGRRAFYVPLIGGVVSVVALFVFISAVLATDPTLLDSVGRI